MIHEVFTPSREEVEGARATVKADRGADAGAVGMGGRMVDRPVVGSRAAGGTVAMQGWVRY